MSVNLSTRYLGLSLKNPVVIAASPLTAKIEWLERLESLGAAAAVLPSLFQEQIEHDTEQLTRVHETGADSFAEALTYFPEPQDYRTGPDTYLELIEAAKKAVKMPIIGSLNGTEKGGWIRYAKMIQDAGADALELNVYYVAADLNMSGDEVESQYLDLVAEVRRSVNIPLAVKIGPYFSSVGHFCRRLVEAGADGLVLFNRFLQPDIDLETLELDSRLILSDPFELLLPLRWTAIMHGRINASLAITSGIHNVESLVKALLVGADVGMIASVIYNEGFDYVGKLVEGLGQWLEQHEYESVEQMKGSMDQENCPDPEAFARGNYMKALVNYTSKPI